MAQRGVPQDTAAEHARLALRVMAQSMAGTRVYVPRAEQANRGRRDARARELRDAGYTVRQIAARLGESADTVMRRLKRAAGASASGAEEAHSGSPSGH